VIDLNEYPNAEPARSMIEIPRLRSDHTLSKSDTENGLMSPSGPTACSQ